MADEVARSINILEHDTSSKEKMRAAETLMRIGDTRAVAPLISALHDLDPHVRGWVATVLGVLKDTRAVAPLIAALHDPDNYVVTCAAVALGELSDERAAEPLITATEHNAYPFLRGAVMAALAKIYESRSLKSRLLLLGSPHSVVRECILVILARMGYKDAFRHLIDTHVLHLYASTLTDSAYTVRGKASWLLSELAKDAENVTLLLPILTETDAQERWAAIVLLGRIGDPRALDPLCIIAQEDHSKIQKGKSVVYLKTAATQAIRVIGRSGP